jgi:2-oxoglutarate dehydrogenase E2 component (dihydrolipoamide succinyltransferase)
MAAVAGVDTSAIAGSGRDGRVTRRDVERRLQQPAGEGVRIVPFSHVRTVAARNLRRSVETAAHAFVSTTVDYTAVGRGRGALTRLPFVARAVAICLERFPRLNARMAGDAALAVSDRVHLGVAVDLGETGLVVPVIRDADGLSVGELADRIADVARLARAGRLDHLGLVGGTFTISNVGAAGTHISVPILPLDQVAMLCVDGIEHRPVAREDGFGGFADAVHPVGNIGLSFAHRAIDGAEAAGFLAAVRTTLAEHDWEAELQTSPGR